MEKLALRQSRLVLRYFPATEKKREGIKTEETRRRAKMWATKTAGAVLPPYFDVETQVCYPDASRDTSENLRRVRRWAPSSSINSRVDSVHD